MVYKWFGSILIIAGCGGVGLSMAANVRTEMRYLRQLLDVVAFLENDLQYRLTPLPEACHLAKEEASGLLFAILDKFSLELDRQVMPDPCSCMSQALRDNPSVSGSLRRLLLNLGHTLGRFDLDGQLRGLRAVKANCNQALDSIHSKRGVQLRSYQTLGLCAGAALAILFI